MTASITLIDSSKSHYRLFVKFPLDSINSIHNSLKTTQITIFAAMVVKIDSPYFTKIFHSYYARWTQKGGQNYFGYKNHIKMDKVGKFIKKSFVSAASLHDSQALDYLAEESDRGQSLHADSAYVGQCALKIPRNQFLEVTYNFSRLEQITRLGIN